MITREALELNARFNAKYKDNGDGTVTARVLGMFDLVVDPTDKSVAHHLMNEGFWEAWITAWLINNFKSGMYFIDVGANTGYYTLLAAHMGGKAIAFEPNPRYVKMLDASRFLPNPPYIVKPFAVADKPGNLTLTIPGDFHGSASVVVDFKDWDEVEKFTVKAVTLDASVEPYMPPKSEYLLKIDAESAEELIWHGASSLLASDRYGVVMLEWTPQAYSDGFVDELFAWGDVTYINFAGQEESLTPEWLAAQEDWAMLVIRKHK